MEEILSDTTGDRSRDPPTGSAVQEWYNLQTFHRGGLVTRWRRWCPAKEVNEFILRRRLQVLPAAFYLPITLMQSAISFSFSCWGEKMHLWKRSLSTGELTIRHVKDVNGLSTESCANTEVLGENHVPMPVRSSQIAMTWDWTPWLHDQKPTIKIRHAHCISRRLTHPITLETSILHLKSCNKCLRFNSPILGPFKNKSRYIQSCWLPDPISSSPLKWPLDPT